MLKPDGQRHFGTDVHVAMLLFNLLDVNKIRSECVNNATHVTAAPKTIQYNTQDLGKFVNDTVSRSTLQ